MKIYAKILTKDTNISTFEMSETDISYLILKCLITTPTGSTVSIAHHWSGLLPSFPFFTQCLCQCWANSFYCSTWVRVSSVQLFIRGFREERPRVAFQATHTNSSLLCWHQIQMQIRPQSVIRHPPSASLKQCGSRGFLLPATLPHTGHSPEWAPRPQKGYLPFLVLSQSLCH